MILTNAVEFCTDVTMLSGWKSLEVGSFWSEPLGLITSFILCAGTSKLTFHFKRKRNWLKSIYYSLFSLLFFIAFIGGLQQDYQPKNIIQTLLVLLVFDRIASLVYPAYNEVTHD